MSGKTQVDAVMRSQVLWGLWLWPSGEIKRRADDRRAHVRADADGDHAPSHHLARAHAGVKALSDDVGEAIIDDDLHVDVGIIGQQLSKTRPERRPHRMVVRRDADRAGGLVPQRAQRRQFRRDLVQAWTRRAQKPLAGLCWRDAAGCAGQQP